MLGTPDVGRLWELMAPIVRLDADDPEQAWRDHMERLAIRIRQIDERRFTALRFSGPGTDLTVGLLDRARWMSAHFKTSWGRDMVANMPSDEVFTTPDCRSAEGTVRRPARCS